MTNIIIICMLFFAYREAWSVLTWQELTVADMGIQRQLFGCSVPNNDCS